MKTHQKNFSKQNYLQRPLTKKDLFAGGKLPEFAIFYNIAFFRIAGLISHLLGKPFESDKNKLEETFQEWLGDATNQNNDKVFSKLRDYLWKGYLTDKNTSGYVLQEQDKAMIVQMLTKLNEVRNFHSHYWHDNSVLVFSPTLKNHIQELHDYAKWSFMGEYANELPDYDQKCKERPLFKQHDNQEFITAEGRVFFLSFFLTRGEMARFLQQHKGSKRNDTKEFKIKHLIYRYYTHRDGAARQHYGQEENVLETMSETEQNEILAARQAFKLISYLNDVPFLSNDPELFPLFVKDKKVETANDLIEFCRANALFNDLEMRQLVKVIKPAKNSKDQPKEVIKEQFIEILLNDYKIHITRAAFHRLIIDSTRNNDNGTKITEKLHAFTQEREYLFKLITDIDYQNAEVENGKITLNDELDEYYRFKLRSGDKLKENMGKWLDKVDIGRFDQKYEEKILAFEEAIKDAPIEVGYYDFYFEAEEKPRSFERFAAFAVQYLIGFKKVPNWCWMVEKFEVKPIKKEVEVYGKTENKELLVNKRTVAFHASIPADSRLAITDEQVMVGIYTNESEEHRQKGLAPRHKFLLGHRAIKNLLIACLEDKKDISGFFDEMITDIDKIKNGDASNLSILTANEIPMSFKIASKEAKPLEIAQLREKANKRISLLISELMLFMEKAPTTKPMSRAEKNRQIMRCYKFFDWNYEDKSEFKFLRKNEYQQMSVYHYCLQDRVGNDLRKGK